jgi:hypothetical protein
VDPVDPTAELYDWAIATYRHWYAARHLISKVLSDLVERPELAPGICQEPSCKHVMLSGYLDRLRQRGLATGDFSPGAAAGMLIGAVFSHAIWRDHFANPDLPPPEEVVRHYVQLLLASLGYRQAPTKGREMA